MHVDEVEDWQQMEVVTKEPYEVDLFEGSDSNINIVD